MSHIVPYPFTTEFVPSVQTQSAPRQAHGMYLVVHPDTVDAMEEKMQQWFEGRQEVVIVDVGTYDKQGLGFLILEWMECVIDYLFLSVLRTEEFAGDYTTYIRYLNIHNKGAY